MATEWKFPPCFKTRADYELWLDNPYQETLPAEHCTDCLPSFKMRMTKAGRCEHPETQFKFYPETGFDADDLGVRIVGMWTPLPMPTVMRKVKYQEVANARIPKRREVAAKTRQEREQDVRDFWAERERVMRERMNFGR